MPCGVHYSPISESKNSVSRKLRNEQPLHTHSHRTLLVWHFSHDTEIASVSSIQCRLKATIADREQSIPSPVIYSSTQMRLVFCYNSFAFCFFLLSICLPLFPLLARGIAVTRDPSRPQILKHPKKAADLSLCHPPRRWHDPVSPLRRCTVRTCALRSHDLKLGPHPKETRCRDQSPKITSVSSGSDTNYLDRKRK